MEDKENRQKAIAEAIGLRIAGVRRQVGVTQEEVATAAGLSVAHLGLMEQGDYEPSASTLIQLAGALGVPETLLLVDLKWLPKKGAFEIPDPPSHYIAGR